MHGQGGDVGVVQTDGAGVGADQARRSCRSRWSCRRRWGRAGPTTSPAVHRAGEVAHHLALLEALLPLALGISSSFPCGRRRRPRAARSCALPPPGACVPPVISPLSVLADDALAAELARGRFLCDHGFAGEHGGCCSRRRSRCSPPARTSGRHRRAAARGARACRPAARADLDCRRPGAGVARRHRPSPCPARSATLPLVQWSRWLSGRSWSCLRGCPAAARGRSSAPGGGGEASRTRR